MLRIEKSVITLEPEEVMELERLVTDADPKESVQFLKRSVYRKILNSQQGRLKSHLDGSTDPAGDLKKGIS